MRVLDVQQAPVPLLKQMFDSSTSATKARALFGQSARMSPAFAPGDRVLLNWAIPCGVCFQCTCGRENICEVRGTVPDTRYHPR